MAERVSRTQEVVDGLLDAIIAGRLVAGDPLPPEGDLAEELRVSRVTLREGVRLLQAEGVIVRVPGRRHRIAPVAEWTGLEAVVRHSRSSRGARERSSLEVLDLRAMLETGAAERAASRRSEEDLAELAVLLERMRLAHGRADVAAFVDADLAFHDVVIHAADNRLLVATMLPLTALLETTRIETSEVSEIRVHAIGEHERVREALVSGDPERAREAMARHMRQTRDDLISYVHGA